MNIILQILKFALVLVVSWLGFGAVSSCKSLFLVYIIPFGIGSAISFVGNTINESHHWYQFIENCIYRTENSIIHKLTAFIDQHLNTLKSEDAEKRNSEQVSIVVYAAVFMMFGYIGGALIAGNIGSFIGVVILLFLGMFSYRYHCVIGGITGGLMGGGLGIFLCHFERLNDLFHFERLNYSWSTIGFSVILGLIGVIVGGIYHKKINLSDSLASLVCSVLIIDAFRKSLQIIGSQLHDLVIKNIDTDIGIFKYTFWISCAVAVVVFLGYYFWAIHRLEAKEKAASESNNPATSTEDATSTWNAQKISLPIALDALTLAFVSALTFALLFSLVESATIIKNLPSSQSLNGLVFLCIISAGLIGTIIGKLLSAVYVRQDKAPNATSQESVSQSSNPI